MKDTLRWQNPSRVAQEGSGWRLEAHPQSDCFISPVDGAATMNAVFGYREVRGDFVIRAKISHAFCSTYDAGALLFLAEDRFWAKLAFELTDLGMHAVVSVITNGTSDDANGVNLEGDSIWLQMARKGNAFAMHYSQDGERFWMHRFFGLPCGPVGRLGISAQSPLGQGGAFVFEQLMLEERTLEDLRQGV